METADFHFEQPWVLTVAVLGGILLFVALCWAERRRRRGLAGFAAARLLDRLTAGYSSARRRTKDVALSVAFAFLIACFAGPRWGVEVSQQKGATEDVVFALDVSKSMLVSDMSPTRLARAKAAIANFIRRKGTGNVGLIAFSGQAFLQCPLTRDYDAFFRTLEETDTSSIQVVGTDIGRAIEESELAFYSNRNRKLLIILTDGEDLEAGGIEMAKQLKRKGLVVHTVGVGTPSGGPMPPAVALFALAKPAKGWKRSDLQSKLAPTNGAPGAGEFRARNGSSASPSFCSSSNHSSPPAARLPRHEKPPLAAHPHVGWPRGRQGAQR